MTRPATLTAHDRFEVLALGRRVAADLAAAVLDAASGLDLLNLLPQSARMDLKAGSLAGLGGVEL